VTYVVVHLCLRPQRAGQAVPLTAAEVPSAAAAPFDVDPSDVKSVELHLNSGDELQMCESSERSMGSLNVIRSAQRRYVVMGVARNQAVAQEPPRHLRIELRVERNQRGKGRCVFDRALVTLIPRTLDAAIHASGAAAGGDSQNHSVGRPACKAALTASGAESVKRHRYPAACAGTPGPPIAVRFAVLFAESRSHECVHAGCGVMRSRNRYKGGPAQARDQLALAEE
jgi:hypothetical protein